MAQRSQSRTLTDHEEIRRWAEERGARPACVRGTGGSGDIGMLRIDFPGYSGETSLEHIGWDEWFDKFDERGLAMLVQDTTAGGQKSNFNKIISQETASEADRNGRGSGRTSGKRTSARSTSTRGRSTGSRTAARTSKRGGGAGRKATAGKAARAGRGAKSQARSRGTAGGGTKSGRGGNARKSTSKSTSRKTTSIRRSSNSRKVSGRTSNRGRSAA
jgi:hypothetical protein